MAMPNPSAAERSSTVAEAAENHLIERSRAGDPAAFARLYAQYQGCIYKVCLARLRDPHLAEDAVQETFIRAYTHLNDFDSSRSLLPWLLTIASRTSLSMLRDRRWIESRDDVDESRVGVGKWARSATDSTADAIVREEQRGALAAELAKLPSRQRRVLMLYAVDGWSYPDIASAEGSSLPTVKSLIFRARARLRASHQAGAFGLLLLPVRGLLARARGAQRRVNIRASAVDPVIVSMLAQQAVAGLAAMVMLVTAVMPNGSPPAGGQTRVTAQQEATTKSVGVPGSASGRRRASATKVTTTSLAAGTAENVRHQLLAPTDHATPAQTQFASIVPSPSFQHDRTAFAMGDIVCERRTCPVLFVTHDAGGHWTQLPAQGLTGDSLLLPPAYPSDRRIFAMGASGLQESDDEGGTFINRSPLTGRVAISPSFDSGDPRILIGGVAVVEYWADRAVVKPAPFPAISPLGTSTAFSPNFRHDNVIVIGGAQEYSGGQTYSSTVWRCQAQLCSSSTLPKSIGMATIRLSPSFGRDETAVAFAGASVFASSDGAKSFKRIDSGLDGLSVSDVAIKPGGREIWAALIDRSQQLRVSYDGARTWTPIDIRLPHFDQGVRTIVTTGSHGPIFAASLDRGLACSVDDGMTWSRTCG